MGRAQQLLPHAFGVRAVNVGVANANAHGADGHAAAGEVRKEVREQCRRGNVKGQAQKQIGAALVHLAREHIVGHVKLIEDVAGRQAHFVELQGVPGAKEDAPAVRVFF